jgi:nucleotide-binding universal stress UspA family protein
METNVLVPLDGSELSEAALPYAEHLARALGWGIVLLRVVSAEPAHDRQSHVAPIEAPLDEEDSTPSGYAALHAEQAAADEGLEAVAARLRTAGQTVSCETGTGPAAPAIADRAAAPDVGLVVMASHGRTGLARVFRGSVAAAVVSQAPRAVLFVRPFRDDSRVELEHAERLPAQHVEAVRQAVGGLAT